MIDSDTALTRCEDLIAMARRMGADAADAVMRADASEGIEIRLGKLESIDRSESESIGLRVFVAATPSGWQVMPGGLTRVASESAVEVISMQRGGLSKDTWVQSDTSKPATSLIKKRLQVADLLDGERDTPSRVGENLFWMGRHAERAEGTSRLLRAALNRLSGHDQVDEEALLGL
ncbi:MAG: alpha-E domain-containing protein, partial [Pseudomonadota bacterium]|nr:alpha-E domain-containing protein [Pseudomonadota bacterium]